MKSLLIILIFFVIFVIYKDFYSQVYEPCDFDKLKRTHFR
jgi:hypothetical protein